VDSEHSAILQCICGAPERAVRRLILTASGGPFREWPLDRLSAVTPAQALRHPTWEMGAKVTVDSATLVNKALEVVEAHFLFDAPYDRIDVVVHPQSIIHSMVEFVDGSVLAQLGFPTMELPILYALTHPQRRADDGVRAFDPVSAGSLTFEAVDAQRFPAFALGIAAGRAGGTAPAVFNAANEEAVAGFLAGAIPFTGIADVIARALDAHDPVPADTLDDVLAADRRARETVCAALRNV
jgi:1-deoxy-D-xylulose-5-phosphate reductoisomerase